MAVIPGAGGSGGAGSEQVVGYILSGAARFEQLLWAVPPFNVGLLDHSPPMGNVNGFQLNSSGRGLSCRVEDCPIAHSTAPAELSEEEAAAPDTVYLHDVAVSSPSSPPFPHCLSLTFHCLLSTFPQTSVHWICD